MFFREETGDKRRMAEALCNLVDKNCVRNNVARVHHEGHLGIKVEPQTKLKRAQLPLEVQGEVATAKSKRGLVKGKMPSCVPRSTGTEHLG